MEQTEPRKFKLRRVKPDQDIIQKNLEPLKQNIHKKMAQEYYYENKDDSGRSPLMRHFNKRPVHQRLGRRVPFNGTNTSAILPKRRFKLPVGSPMKRTRIFTAQQRLNRIRANQREVLQNSNTAKRIKLRRTLPQQGGPTNLMVQVRNSNAITNRQQRGYKGARRFRQILNMQLQHEIRKIQMDFQDTQIIAPFRVTPVATQIFMHQRFAQLI